MPLPKKKIRITDINPLARFPDKEKTRQSFNLRMAFNDSKNSEAIRAQRERSRVQYQYLPNERPSDPRGPISRPWAFEGDLDKEHGRAFGVKKPIEGLDPVGIEGPARKDNPKLVDKESPETTYWYLDRRRAKKRRGNRGAADRGTKF
jgi:hypothetical protein